MAVGRQLAPGGAQRLQLQLGFKCHGAWLPGGESHGTLGGGRGGWREVTWGGG